MLVLYEKRVAANVSNFENFNAVEQSIKMKNAPKNIY